MGQPLFLYAETRRSLPLLLIQMWPWTTCHAFKDCSSSLRLLRYSHNFCIYHIDAPGHELGAAAISSDVAIPTVDERRSSNVMRFMQVISRRYNLTEGLKKLQVQDTHICGRKLSISFRSSSQGVKTNAQAVKITNSEKTTWLLLMLFCFCTEFLHLLTRIQRKVWRSISLL